MYLPKAFEEKRLPVLCDVMRTCPFATLVVRTAEGMDAAHIPFEWSPEPAPLGCLRGHVARANTLWKDFDAQHDVLVMFQGPHAYVSPDWYPGSKTHGKEVPTWDYVVVHAEGRMRVIDDPAWLRPFLETLTRHHESDRPTPWHVDDAPADFIADQMRYIVGVEIPVTRLTGKWKASQNRAMADRRGALEGLRREGGPTEQAMADVVARYVK